jgi:hypothetical protein
VVARRAERLFGIPQSGWYSADLDGVVAWAEENDRLIIGFLLLYDFLAFGKVGR